MRGYFSGLIRLDGTFQAVARAPGEITQLRPVVAVRGNLTINKALKLAELEGYLPFPWPTVVDVI